LASISELRGMTVVESFISTNTSTCIDQAESCKDYHDLGRSSSALGAQRFDGLALRDVRTFSRLGCTDSTPPTGTPRIRTGVPTVMPHATGNSRMAW
jgi:hypothetical protein